MIQFVFQSFDFKPLDVSIAIASYQLTSDGCIACVGCVVDCVCVVCGVCVGCVVDSVFDCVCGCVAV
jgi:hypothetical protein